MPKSPRFPPIPRRVEILAFPDVQLLDVAGPLQVFASANVLAQDRGEPPPYDPIVVAAEAIVTSSAMLPLVTHPLPTPGAAVDTFIVAGGIGVHRLCGQAHMLQWLRARTKTARRTASVCSGAFALAAAGLLDGKPAVTHWRNCAEFAARFPNVKLDPDPIFVRAGNIWTSAGVTAGIDLALALVEADLGHERALAVARQLVVFLKRPGGQAQFSATLALQQHGQGFAALHAWIADHLTDELTIAALAHVAGMSERSFLRHYQQATGQTPARAVERIRVEAARQMLEQGQAVKSVARKCGFGSEETMRRAFLRRLNVTPSAYRERFAGLAQHRAPVSQMAG